MAIIALLSGPNLNLLGVREPEIYGTATLDDHVETAQKTASRFRLDFEHFQSNHEGELVDEIHRNRDRWDGIVINPAALTHYGWSLHDALAAFEGPIIELHLSNPNTRESWRHVSVVAPVATGSIIGLGGHGYCLAVEALAHELGVSKWRRFYRLPTNQSVQDTDG